MIKAEWGIKRQCLSCGARFYDLQRSPILCPKCGTEHDPEAVLRTRRNRTLPVEKAPVPSPLEDDVKIDEVPDDEGDELIEDASELGEDEEVTEVIEHVEEE